MGELQEEKQSQGKPAQSCQQKEAQVLAHKWAQAKTIACFSATRSRCPRNRHSRDQATLCLTLGIPHHTIGRQSWRNRSFTIPGSCAGACSAGCLTSLG